MPESPIRRPDELAGVDVAVGYHSGSHFSTIQALEPFLPTDEIKLRFGGFPYDRVDALLAGEVPAAAVWGASTYLVEQHGCRRILDTTFMAAFTGGAELEPLDGRKIFVDMNGNGVWDFRETPSEAWQRLASSCQESESPP